MIPAAFDHEIYDIVREIPPGRVATYGQIARLAGMPQLARRVGRAMGSAPTGVPCHRVVSSGGRLVAAWPEQRTLLEAEGVLFRPNGNADLRSSEWEAVLEMNSAEEVAVQKMDTTQESDAPGSNIFGHQTFSER